MIEELIHRRAVHRTLTRTIQRPGSTRTSYLFRINSFSWIFLNFYYIIMRNLPIRRFPVRHNVSHERPREQHREDYHTTYSIVPPGQICYWSRNRQFSHSSEHREVSSPLSDHDVPHPSHGSTRLRRVFERMSRVPWVLPFFHIALCSRKSRLCSRTRTPTIATNNAFYLTRRENETITIFRCNNIL